MWLLWYMMTNSTKHLQLKGGAFNCCVGKTVKDLRQKAPKQNLLHKNHTNWRNNAPGPFLNKSCSLNENAHSHV